MAFGKVMQLGKGKTSDNRLSCASFSAQSQRGGLAGRTGKNLSLTGRCR